MSAGASQLDLEHAARVEVPAGRLTLAGLRSGAADGPPVLLVPGFTGSKEDFGPLLAPLSGAGYCVTAIDLPGQFESPAAGSGGYGVQALGTVVAAAVRSVSGDRPVRLVGHSFGGLVARSAVTADPAPYSSLVLLDSGPGAIGGLRRDLIAAAESLVPSGVAGIYAALEALAAADPDRPPVPPALAEFLRTRFLANDLTGLVEMGNALRDEPDRVEELRAAGVRCAVICGAQDDAWSPEVQREMAGRLGAVFVEIPEAGHSPAVENPGPLLEALLEFWA